MLNFLSKYVSSLHRYAWKCSGAFHENTKNISIPLAEISCSVTGTVQDIATGLVHRKGKYFILFPGFDSIQQDFHSCGIMVMVIWMGPLSIQDHMH